MKKIPIYFTFDNNYVVPAAVAFYSLLEKAKKNVYYEMFVLHSDITAENQMILHDIIETISNASLLFIDTKDFLKTEWANGNFADFNKTEKSKFTVDTIIACFGAHFFPQYDKIICSDVDVVFMDDISELIDTNMDNAYFAGVKNPWMKYHKNELMHLSPQHYEMLKDSFIGTGILVLNMKKIRDDSLEQKMINVIKDESIEKKWPDQDIINIACENKVSFLPLNYISYPYMQDQLQNPDFISHYSQDEMFDSIINPKILHYADKKPWNWNVRYKDIWWAIFEHLQLPKTSIFRSPETEATALQPKKNTKTFKQDIKDLIKVMLSMLSKLPLIGFFFKLETIKRFIKRK